jgi:hypothetical protein
MRGVSVTALACFSSGHRGPRGGGLVSATTCFSSEPQCGGLVSAYLVLRLDLIQNAEADADLSAIGRHTAKLDTPLN